MKGAFIIFLRADGEKKIFLMEIDMKDNMQKDYRMVRENMSGRTVFNMMVIFFKVIDKEQGLLFPKKD